MPTDVAAAVHEAVALVAGIGAETLQPSTRLVEDLGLDSAALVELLAILSGLGMAVDEDMFLEVSSVGQLIRAVSDPEHAIRET